MTDSSLETIERHARDAMHQLSIYAPGRFANEWSIWSGAVEIGVGSTLLDAIRMASQVSSPPPAPL